MSKESYMLEYSEWVSKTKEEIDNLDPKLLGLICFHCKEKISELPHRCFISSSKINILICKECSTKFAVVWQKGGCPCCSYKCAIRRGNKEKEWIPMGSRKILINCLWCGKEFFVEPWRLKKDRGVCCSFECSDNWKRKFFEDHPEERAKQSLRMKEVWKNLKIKLFRRSFYMPTAIEKFVSFFNYSGLVYTGSGNYPILFKDGTTKYPDFILDPINETKKVIEVAGNYWHNKEEMNLVIKKYKEVGYDCLVLWEDEIVLAPYIVANKIRKFTHTLTVGIFKLNKGLPDPIQAYDFDSGFDLHSRINLKIPPGEVALIPCGVVLILPDFVECQIRGRSGLAKKGILTHFGTVDSQFRGEIGPILYNTTSKDFNIRVGDRICQAVISPKWSPPVPIEKIKLLEVDSFDETSRGEKGFGSSGENVLFQKEKIKSILNIKDGDILFHPEDICAGTFLFLDKKESWEIIYYFGGREKKMVLKKADIQKEGMFKDFKILGNIKEKPKLKKHLRNVSYENFSFRWLFEENKRINLIKEKFKFEDI